MTSAVILAGVGFSLLAAKPGEKELVEVTEANLATKGAELFGGAFRVEARNDRQPDGSSAWSFAYSGNTGAYEIVEILYPKVIVRHSPEARLLYPHPTSPGRIAWPEWDKLRPGQTIAETRMGVPPFRFVSVLEPEGESFYLDMRDTVRDARTFRMRRGEAADEVEIAVRYPVSLTPANRVSLVSPLRGTMRTFRGGWFEAALIYRPWAVRQPWCTGAAARRKLSPAIDDIALWLWLRGPSDDTVPVVERVRRELGLPVGFDWYWWHAIPYDSGYPFFWPPREGEAKFREVVKRMNDAGVLMQVYTNGQAWDRDDPSWARDGGINEVKMDRNGSWIEVAFNRYTGHRLSYVCGEAPKFQSHMLDLSRKLTGAGLRMYYMDQISAAAHGVCSNPAHTHAPGGGPQVADGFRSMVAKIREANPGVMLMSEEFSENYLDAFDMLETCFTCYERCGWGARPRVEVVPVVQALYHPFVRAMGSYSIMDGIPPWDPKWPDKDRWQVERDWKREFPDQFAYEYCRTVVWGIQPTVHQLRLADLDDPRYAADCRFLFDTARFFHANRKFLWEGEMLAPGRLDCAAKPVDFMVRGIYTKDGEERRLRDEAVPTVLHSRWRAPDGSVATVAVNWTDEPQRFAFGGRTDELAPKSWVLLGPSCW